MDSSNTIQNNSILVFAPHSVIWAFTSPLALIAKTAEYSGYSIDWITCDGEFYNYCLGMTANGLKFEDTWYKKKSLCKICKAKDKALYQLGFNFHSLKEIKQGIPIAEKVSRLYQDALQDPLGFLHCEIPLGRYAAYQYILRKKINKISNEALRNSEYRHELMITITSYVVGEEMIKKTKPCFILTWNSLYSTNFALRAAGLKNGIPSRFVINGGNLATQEQDYIFGIDHPSHWMNSLVKWFQSNEHFPIDNKDISYVVNHFKALFSGEKSLCYSAPISKGLNIRQIFNISKNQKILLATLSSLDEYKAATMLGISPPSNSLIFSSQIEWLEKIINWIRNKHDLFLIIRVHPREFPSKRENQTSEHAIELDMFLKNLPSNVAVNTPSQELSLYEVAEYTDVVLNAWSTSGKELAMFGLPVVLYAHELVLYPKDLNYWANDPDEYFAQISLALRNGWQESTLIKACRWHILEFSKSIMTNSVLRQATKNNSLLTRAFRRIGYEEFNSQQIKDIDAEAFELSKRNPSYLSKDFQLFITPPNHSKDSSAADRDAIIKIIKGIIKARYGNTSDAFKGPLYENLVRFSSTSNRHSYHPSKSDSSLQGSCSI